MTCYSARGFATVSVSFARLDVRVNCRFVFQSEPFLICISAMRDNGGVHQAAINYESIQGLRMTSPLTPLRCNDLLCRALSGTRRPFNPVQSARPPLLKTTAMMGVARGGRNFDDERCFVNAMFSKAARHNV
jgi:hypothetical protein